MKREDDKKETTEITPPEGFSRFQWALAGFCLPIVLWPLAILISPSLNRNPHLSELQISAISIFLWIYPFVLGIAARFLFRLEQRNHSAAKRGLLLGAAIFYAVLGYVVTVGFGG